jgi:hypothetical protein
MMSGGLSGSRVSCIPGKKYRVWPPDVVVGGGGTVQVAVSLLNEVTRGAGGGGGFGVVAVSIQPLTDGDVEVMSSPRAVYVG